ncbi:MAG: DNA gyrase subunit A, partial [Actinobacteria bacterium]|nr:DNA gyrase subunit A [Actinomycetota bacterium]
RQKINDEYDALMADIVILNAILISPEKQRDIVKTELADLVAKYGDERRTQIVASEGDFSAEDLIPDQDVVVTITRGGYSKRTMADLYRSQRRGGRGVKGAALKEDDVVDHFFVASTHDWLLFFTNQGRVYRAKVHELPDAGRDARGQHVANLMAFKPDEKIAEVLSLKDYTMSPFLVLATKKGLIKKTPLIEFDSPRTGGLIAISLKPGDEVVGASLVNNGDELLLVSTKGESSRGSLVSALVLRDEDEVLAITSAGTVMRTPAAEVRQTGRDSMGVRLVNLDEGVALVSVTKNSEDEISSKS